MNYENEIWKDIVIEKNGEVYDYTGLYQISNYGRVKSLDRIDASGHKIKGKIIKLKIDAQGYLYVKLYKDGKHKGFTVHRLVATAFIPNPDNLPVVNHVSEVKSENFVWNLEWCTQKYNVQYSSYKRKGQKRTEESKKKMSENHADINGDKNPMYGKHHTDESRRKNSESHKGKYDGAKNPNAKKVICLETKQVFGTIKEAQELCSKGNISDCLRGKTKTCGGYHWMYLEDYKRQLRMESDINNSKLIA